jgi:hypothetical protein
VQDEDCFLKPDGVHGAIRSVRIVFDHLQHRSVSKAFQRLGCFVPLAVPSKMQCMPEEPSHKNRQRHQVLLAAPNPDQRCFNFSCRLIIPEKE